MIFTLKDRTFQKSSAHGFTSRFCNISTSFLQIICKSVDNEHLMLVMFYRHLYACMTEKKYCAIIFSVSFVCSLIRAANNSQSLDNMSNWQNPFCCQIWWPDKSNTKDYHLVAEDLHTGRRGVICDLDYGSILQLIAQFAPVYCRIEYEIDLSNRHVSVIQTW